MIMMALLKKISGSRYTGHAALSDKNIQFLYTFQILVVLSAIYPALLNSFIGIFYIEATGFPKGLGALDTRAENIKKIFMLDPRCK
jgi:hypothetical protein